MANYISFLADTSFIEQKHCTKILGFSINNQLCHGRLINYLIWRVNLYLHILKMISNYMNCKVIICIINSLVLSLIRYVMPL